MILVDIGNSGVRAISLERDTPFSDDSLVRLSWPAKFSVRGKVTPGQHSDANQRWCTAEDDQAFDWLASQFSPKQSWQWIVSSVHQGAAELLMASVMRRNPQSHWFVVSHDQIPMRKDVDSPEKTGIDRMLAAFESWSQQQAAEPNEKTPRPIVVMQAGTALTVDLVTVDGVYAGGAILPGLGLSLQLLAAGTDQLPWLGNHQVHAELQLPGRNTAEAIAAGVHASLAGGAQFLLERYRSTEQGRDAIAIVSGGDGSLLVPHLKAPVRFVNHLVLRGLHRLASQLPPMV